MIYGNISNCTVVGHGTRSEYQTRLGYEVISENTETNSRQIKLQLEARTINSSYTTWGVSQTPTIDGVTLKSGTVNLRTANAWQVFGTRIITINGAYNGTKRGSFTTNATGEWALKSGSASVAINLDDLHTPPVINSVDLVEKNTLLQNYTGIAQYLSVKNITFDTSTYDNAIISSYQVYHNGVLIGSSTSNGMTINFDEVGTLATFEMNGKTYCGLKFIVIDSFGISGSLEQQIEVTEYTKPNLVQTSSNVKRNGQLTGKVKLNLVGIFFNNLVNDISNTIKLEFAYWKKGGDESNDYYEIPFEAEDNNINLYSWNVTIDDKEIEDVDKDFAYIFKIRATDYFNRTSSIELLCPVGEYVWAEFKDRVDFKNITIQGEKILKSKVLYDDMDGTNGDIKLSDNISNYEYLEIFYSGSSKGLGSSTKVLTTCSSVMLMIAVTTSGHLWVNTTELTLGINTLTVNRCGDNDIGPTPTINYSTESNIYVYKVLGYKQ